MAAENKKGFTLLEVIIVATIFSVVGVGIISSLVSGINVWDRVRNYNFTEGNALLTMEMIAKELRQSIHYPTVGFEGKAQSLSFPVVKDNDIVKITYTFDAGEKVLVRQQEDAGDVTADESSLSAAKRHTLFADNFSVEYFDLDPETTEYQWVDGWESVKGIFKAVRLTIEMKDKEFSKTVFIPISG